MIRFWTRRSLGAIAKQTATGVILGVFSIGSVTWATIPSTPSTLECLKFLGKVYELIHKAHTQSTFPDQVSERDRELLTRCPSILGGAPNPQLPTPTFAQCLTAYQAVWEERWDLLLKIPEVQRRSLVNCSRVIGTFYIPSSSMLPTLQVNDRILIDKTIYQRQSPQRGDLIIFQPTPTLRQEGFSSPFLKRIIGLPGETLQVKEGAVYINQQRLQEHYIAAAPDYRFGPVKIPSDSYFVLGDNRNNSYDSHYYGFVTRNLIIGKVVWRYYPITRMGSL